MASKVQMQVHHVRFFEYQPLPINCMTYDASSHRMAVSRSDGSVQILSTIDNWTQELSFPGGKDSSVETLVWSQQRLFAGGLGGNVVELDLETQLAKVSVSSNAGPIWCLTGNKEETQLAAGTEDGCVVLFCIEDELQFLRLFGKQEGRIISIAWYSNADQNIIITGGANNIRQWSVNSGQPISRMTVGTNNFKETIVWCLTVTNDFTIISGDSRGVVSFWNGKLATQMKTFHCHKADVLCLCLSQDEMTVYSGGVDAGVYQFSCYTPNPDSDRRRWIHRLLHSYHTHDIRGLAFTGGCVVSGGVDCFLQVARLGDVKQVRPISPFPGGSLVDIDKDHNLILLQYKTYLEIWRLGDTESTDEKSRGILPLSRNPVKLIQLKAKEEQEIACSCLSNDGTVAFSDLQQVRLYRFDAEKADSPSPQLCLERIKHSFAHPTRLMVFTPSGDHLIAALVGSGLEVMNTKTGAILHRLSIDSLILQVTASPDSQHIAYSTISHEVYVTDVVSGQVVCHCPVVSSQVSAINFSPHSSSLFIAYCNHKVYEMDIIKKEYSRWCRDNTPKFPVNWMQSFKTIKQILFQPNFPNRIVLYTDTCLAVLDRKATDISGLGYSANRCWKYKYLMYADFVRDGSLVVVERLPSMIDDQLPPSLKQKKFGIA